MKQSYTSLDSYILTKTLGSGSTSKIKLGVHIETGQQVVVKVYRQRAGASAMNEVSYFARKIQHRNLLKAYEYNLKGVLIKRGSSKARYRAYCTIEPCIKGDMFSFVKALGQFPELIARFYTRQLFDGLEALHTVGKMFHGDVKLDNLLVSNTYDLKICDFGFSGSSDTTLVSPCGTLGYLAPEIFTYEGYNGTDADQFSAFVVLFILVCGHPPFYSARQSDPRYRLLSEEAFDEFWSKQSSSATVSREFKELVQRGLAVDKSLRPSL